MTIASAVSKATLNGNGSTTAFPFGFKVWKAADLEVSVTDASGAVSVVTNWSVVLTPSGGGTVTYPLTGSPLPTGHKITIARSMDFLQDVDLVSGTRWDPEVVETALDRATAERQQLKERLDRAVTTPISSSTTPEQLASDLFAARDTAVSAASSAANSAATAQVAANSIGVLSASGTLTAGQDTITLPWSYDTGTGNVAVFLGGVKQVRSTLTFLTSTTVRVGAAVTENTPYEVTSVTLSAESVLTGLRDQCVTAKTGAETARTGAEAAESSALSSLNALLAVVSPDLGKYNRFPVRRTAVQAISAGVEANVLTDGTPAGDLNITPSSGTLGWTVVDAGRYRIDVALEGYKNTTSTTNIFSFVKLNRGGTITTLESALHGLMAQTTWQQITLTAVADLQAGDIIYATAQADGGAVSIYNNVGQGIITRIR